MLGMKKRLMKLLRQSEDLEDNVGSPEGAQDFRANSDPLSEGSFVRQMRAKKEKADESFKAQADAMAEEVDSQGKPDPNRIGTEVTQRIFDRGINSGRLTTDNKDKDFGYKDFRGEGK
jgi:hypothetical protein